MSAENWRDKELSLEQVYEKYPDIPKLIILKTDVQRRGFVLTDAAKEEGGFTQSKIKNAQDNRFLWNVGNIPLGLILRDGTLVCGGYGANSKARDPYVIDYIDGKFRLTDAGKVYEEVEFWKLPDFINKRTSRGTQIKDIIALRPQRINIALEQGCHFWDYGKGCKYCTVGILSKKAKAKEEEETREEYYSDIAESVAEAIKYDGRYTMLMVTTGSILSGKKIFDDEVDAVIKFFEKLKPVFKNRNLKVQLISSAYDKEQQKRLRDATGIISYTPDIEVLNKEQFNWICPGKASFVGYDEWKKRIIDAVDVFGPGNVNTGIVGGVELAKPNGFSSEEEALKAVLREAEDFAQHGVSIAYGVWGIGGVFRDQIPPSLDYYIAFAKGIDQINRKYGLKTYFDDYRRCGNHPSTDLSRIW